MRRKNEKGKKEKITAMQANFLTDCEILSQIKMTRQRSVAGSLHRILQKITKDQKGSKRIVKDCKGLQRITKY